MILSKENWGFAISRMFKCQFEENDTGISNQNSGSVEINPSIIKTPTENMVVNCLQNLFYHPFDCFLTELKDPSNDPCHFTKCTYKTLIDWIYI